MEMPKKKNSFALRTIEDEPRGISYRLKDKRERQTGREYELQEVGIKIADLLRADAIISNEEAASVFAYARKIAFGEYSYRSGKVSLKKEVTA